VEVSIDPSISLDETMKLIVVVDTTRLGKLKK